MKMPIDTESNEASESLTTGSSVGRILVVESGVEAVQFERPLWMPDLQLLTVVEVAQILGVSRSKVYELLYSRALQSVKIGGSRRIRYSDLGEYVRCLDDAS
jgi:excisionase family DNA binding protein